MWKFNPFTKNFDIAPDSYANSTPMPSTVGGWEAGSTFTGQSSKQMWDGLLYPYGYPSFTAFSLASYSVFEIGDGVSAGSHNFTWANTNHANINPNSIDILDITGATTLISGTANDGSEPYNFLTPVTSSTPNSSYTYRVRGTNTHSQIFQRDLTLYWRAKRFYGESVNAGPLVEADVEALRINELASGFAGTYVFAAGGYKYIAYETTLGTATVFKDQATNLGVPFEAYYTISITNTFGVVKTYKVHRSTNILGGSITILVS
jgi:hypothetical protein